MTRSMCLVAQICARKTELAHQPVKSGTLKTARPAGGFQQRSSSRRKYNR